jgi:uncharacterized protein (DUF2164 family)
VSETVPSRSLQIFQRWCCPEHHWHRSKYFEANLEERIGNLEANALLGFILEEIGPSIYNKGVADAQERMQARLSDKGSGIIKVQAKALGEFFKVAPELSI